MHIAGGMLRWNIEGVEIVVLGLDLGAVDNREAERGEEVFDFHLDLGYGMQAAGRRAGGGERQVDPFGIETLLQRIAGEGLDLRFESALQGLFGGIERFAGAGAILRRELAEAFAELRERSFAAQRLDADGLDIGERLRDVNAIESGGLELRNFLL